jgi:hypothetical protein
MSARNRQNITEDSRETHNIEQHILTDSIDKVQRFYSNNKKLFGYRTFRQVNGSGTRIINRLKGIDNIGAFYDVKQSVLSLMQPKIKIFRVTYDQVATTPDGRTKRGSREVFQVPCYREFKFSNNFGFEMATSVQDYLSYESTKPAFRNVALKKFSVEQIGETHGAMENNIECTLELAFKSLKDLQAQPPGEPSPKNGGLRYVDLILFPETKIDPKTKKYNPKHYQIKVLMGYTGPTEEQMQGLNLSPRERKSLNGVEKLNTLLSLGLYDHTLTIKENGQVSLIAKYRGAIETVFGSSQVNIFQDTLTTTSGGKKVITDNVKMETNTGRIVDLANELKGIHKGLTEDTCVDIDCPARKKLKELLTGDREFRNFYKSTAGEQKFRSTIKETKTGKSLKGDGAFVWFGDPDNVDKMIALMKKKVGGHKKNVYKTFIDQLIVGNKSQEGTRLFCASAGKKTIKKLMGIIEKAEEATTESDYEKKQQTDKLLKSSSIAVSKEMQDVVTVGRCSRVAGMQDIAKTREETANLINSSIDVEAGDEEKKDANRKSIISSGTGSYQFYFLFLGDIIELACKNSGMFPLKFPEDLSDPHPHVFRKNSYMQGKEIGLDYPLTGMRMLLGPVEYYNSAGKLKRINLAQFPISFNNFRAWFAQKVIRRDRVRMPLGSFITLLINDLVVPALGAGFLKVYKPRGSRAQAVALTLPGEQIKGEKIQVCGRESSQIAELLPQERVIDTESPLFVSNYYKKVSQPIPSETMVKTSYDYWLVYISSVKDISQRRGRPSEDIEDGIYHFNIGSDVGLLKSMSFEKVDIPGMVELRSLQNIEEGTDPTTQLTFPYNVSLDLIGNSLFTPGMYFYANPSFLGLGAPEDANSLAHQLNLGGYFFVGRSTMEISSGRFSTKIHGLQQGHGLTRGR